MWQQAGFGQGLPSAKDRLHTGMCLAQRPPSEFEGSRNFFHGGIGARSRMLHGRGCGRLATAASRIDIWQKPQSCSLGFGGSRLALVLKARRRHLRSQPVGLRPRQGVQQTSLGCWHACPCAGTSLGGTHQSILWLGHKGMPQSMSSGPSRRLVKEHQLRCFLPSTSAVVMIHAIPS